MERIMHKDAIGYYRPSCSGSMHGLHAVESRSTEPYQILSDLPPPSRLNRLELGDS
ncbi:uncharacterized protein FIBRA_07210 [Fibroporia radiculosa]|uniref:Uncharacterized protein n=1 Tax=Fibroporia radiculosa TaxID=599839 RepID=J4IBP3_9APHY|nr:uncharacterized protein FIBRA_07210 [Fibroporia radiculosa]CCM05011.1 predicted protein [Fibroporia radiculosa]